MMAEDFGARLLAVLDDLLQLALERLDGLFGHCIAPQDQDVVELEGHRA
jgi:hypothetical protein